MPTSTTLPTARPVAATRPSSARSARTSTAPDPRPGRSALSRWRGLIDSRTTSWLAPLLTFAAVLVAWEVASVNGIVADFVLPPPSEIADALVTIRASLLTHARVTATEALAGFALGSAIGIGMAVAFVHSKTLHRCLYPLVIAAKTIPIVALAPVLVLWLGVGITSKIMVATFLSFFPMLVNMVKGLRSIDRDVAELLDSLSASRLQVLTKVRLPASLPFMFSALRLSAATCYLGAIVAEWIGANQGLGYVIVIRGYQYQIPELWAAVTVASVLALATFAAVAGLEKLVTPWSKASGAAVSEA